MKNVLKHYEKSLIILQTTTDLKYLSFEIIKEFGYFFISAKANKRSNKKSDCVFNIELLALLKICKKQKLTIDFNISSINNELYITLY